MLVIASQVDWIYVSSVVLGLFMSAVAALEVQAEKAQVAA
jgi:hypothetical protein